MEPQFKSSFIPKKPITTQVKPGYVPGTKSGVGFFTMITIVIFLATVLFAGGVYVYKLSLKTQIDNQIVQLETAKKEFDKVFIDEATRLNARIVGAQKLLQGHVAPSVIFSLLEEFTLKTVQFTNFTFTDKSDGTIDIMASGIANSFRSVVLQSDKFGESGYLRNVLFSGLQPNIDRNVTFTLTATLDPQFVLFANGLSTAPIEDEVPAVESVETPEEDFGVFGNNENQQ